VESGRLGQELDQVEGVIKEGVLISFKLFSLPALLVCQVLRKDWNMLD
jgi:hypothetical protein